MSIDLLETLVLELLYNEYFLKIRRVSPSAAVKDDDDKVLSWKQLVIIFPSNKATFNNAT